MEFIMAFVEKLTYFFQDYKTIFIICGICIFISFLSHLNETGWGAIITLMCWIVTLSVCSVGGVCFVKHVKSDVQQTNKQIARSIESTDYYKEIKATNAILHEDLDMSIGNVMSHPEQAVDKLLTKAEKMK